MSGFIFGGGICRICKRGGCVPSFHSIEEQEAAERDEDVPDTEPEKSELSDEHLDGNGFHEVGPRW